MSLLSVAETGDGGPQESLCFNSFLPLRHYQVTYFTSRGPEGPSFLHSYSSL